MSTISLPAPIVTVTSEADGSIQIATATSAVTLTAADAVALANFILPPVAPVQAAVDPATDPTQVA